jgi:hypothetical protein
MRSSRGSRQERAGNGENEIRPSETSSAGAAPAAAGSRLSRQATTRAFRAVELLYPPHTTPLERDVPVKDTPSPRDIPRVRASRVSRRAPLRRRRLGVWAADDTLHGFDPDKDGRRLGVKQMRLTATYEGQSFGRTICKDRVHVPGCRRGPGRDRTRLRAACDPREGG